MLTIGCHLSTTKGYRAMGETALSIGANTFAFFTRNPRGGKAKDLDMDDVAALRELMEQNDFGPLVAHAPYTYNPCSLYPHAPAKHPSTLTPPSVPAQTTRSPPVPAKKEPPSVPGRRFLFIVTNFNSNNS